MIKNPENKTEAHSGFLFEEAVSEVCKLLGRDEQKSENCREKALQRKIILAGIGPGDERYHTKELTDALKCADVIFGAKSVLERLSLSGIPVYEWYEGEKIWDILEEHPEYTAPVVIFSGDISLCSGAKKAGVFLEERGYQVRKITGISSVALFAGKIGAVLEDVEIISAHGRECDVNGYVRRNEKVILLAGSPKEALETAGNLPEGCRTIFGCELGTSEEKISEYGSEDFDENEIKGKVRRKQASRSKRDACCKERNQERIDGSWERLAQVFQPTESSAEERLVSISSIKSVRWGS